MNNTQKSAFSTRDSGGADTCKFLKDNMSTAGKVKAFSDNNRDKIGTVYFGLPVIQPTEIVKKYKNCLMLISSTVYDLIRNS